MLQLSSIPPGICDLAITRINGKSTNPRRLVHSWIRFTTHRASNLTNRLSRNCSGKDFVPSSLFSVFKLTKLNHFLPKTNQLLWGACWQHYLARQEVVKLQTEFWGEENTTAHWTSNQSNRAFLRSWDSQSHFHSYWNVLYSTRKNVYSWQVFKYWHIYQKIYQNRCKL